MRYIFSMTRREMLAILPAAATPAPAQGARPSFDRIDVHMHIHRVAPALFAGMEKSGWRGLSIFDSRAVGDEASDLDEMIRGTAEMQRTSNGRFAWAATFDARTFETRDFTAETIALLRQCFDQGAIGVKIWKNIGMKIRSKSGQYLMPDSPVLMPVYEAIQKAGRTLIAHLAEPDGAWLPIDDKNPEIGYYKSNPQWHMSSEPGAPNKESILAARDRIMSTYPKLRLVGCHLGSNEENLARLGKRFDTLPNFAVDVAARVRYLAAADRATVRELLTKYQDRILYGTDSQLRNSSDEEGWKAINARQEQEWNFFAGTEVMQFRNREVQGLGLPEKVLRKIFHDNAYRWLPGIPR
jgi:predicted TIM-barrel fold metal-dependent hydrolase